MSVTGEFARYYAELITRLDSDSTPRAANVRQDLLAARRSDDRQLVTSAELILSVLTQSGLASRNPESAPGEFSSITRETADTLVSLCRIVLGR